MVDRLLGTERGDWVRLHLAEHAGDLHAPHLLDVEVFSALRRRVALGQLDGGRAERSLEAFSGLTIERYPHTGLLGTMWRHRATLTAYDAAYVALAEALDATVVTTDGRLGRAGLGDRVVAYPG